MSTILNTTQQYNAADVVTHTNLNQIVGGTTFVAGDDGATDNTSLEVDTTSGSLRIKNQGVTLANELQEIQTNKILGRTTALAGVVEEIGLNTDDAMASSSATTLATDGSIKTYVDGEITDHGITQSTGAAPYYGVRAWCQYNGSTQVINGSGNIASVTRHNTGDYEFFFTEEMPTAGYAISLSYSNEVGSGTGFSQHTVGFISGHTTTSFRVEHYAPGGSGYKTDKAYVGVSVIC